MKNLENEKIVINAYLSICPKSIISLQADTNYTWLHLENGKKIIVASTLKKVQKAFSSYQNFFRLNRSNIINMDYIQNYDLYSLELSLKNEMTTLIARRRKAEFVALMQSKKMNFNILVN